MSSMSSMGDDEAITLQSGDSEMFSVSKVVACHAVTIKEMLEGTESGTTIPLPNLQGPILSKVIEYCTWHVGAEADGASEDAQNDWQAKFVEVDQGTLCHLIVAANYLNIAPLVDHLGFRPEIGHENASDRRADYRGYYEDETAARVAYFCAADIERFKVINR